MIYNFIKRRLKNEQKKVKKYDGKFKVKLVIEALKEDKTLSQIGVNTKYFRNISLNGNNI